MKKIRLAIDAVNIKSGGVIVHLDGILNNFKSKNIDKIYVLINDKAFRSLQKRNNYSKKIKFIKKEIFNKNILLIFLWQLFFLEKFINKKKCNRLVSLNGYYLGSFKKTIIFSQNALPFVGTKDYKFFYRIKLFLQKYIHIYSINKFKNVIFVSKFQKKIIQKYLNSLKIKYKIIYHGVDSGIIKKKTYSKNKWNFIYVSQINLYKNQIILFQVFNKLIKQGFKISLHCYGDNQINLSSDNNFIKIIKSINQKKINKIYQKYDSFIFPSSVESFGLPLLEASRAGLPICCSGLSVFKEIIDKKNLITFNEKNPNDIERKIRNIIFMKKKKLKKIIKLNYLRSLNFNWNKSSSQFFNFIENI